MTVTPANVGRGRRGGAARWGGWASGCCRSSPPRYVGDDRRWREEYRGRRREPGRGVGRRSSAAPAPGWTTGCSRTATCAATAPRTASTSGDAGCRSSTRTTPATSRSARRSSGPCAESAFGGTPPALLVVKLLRLVAAQPRVLVDRARLGGAQRPAGSGSRRCCVRASAPVTFVMHQFMDAADVAPAWELMQRGQSAATTRGCARPRSGWPPATTRWAPETGTLVPACVQHGVLDPGENAALRRPAADADVRRGRDGSR